MILIAIAFTLIQVLAFHFATWLYGIHDMLGYLFIFGVACSANELFNFIYKYGKSEGRKENYGRW